MHKIGIIAEYNPFHNGHLYQIKEIKKRYPDSTIISVVSSSFTQRGDISLLNKWDKTKIALDNGIDLVIELPFVYSTQASDIFAEGSIKILNYLGIDTLVFGTERDTIEDLELLANIQINNKEYQEKKEQEKVVHEPTGSYGMDTITMRQKIMERVMLMEENQLKEMLRFSNELEQKSWLLPHTQEELEIAINRGMEDVKAGRIVSHEDVLKYYMK